MSVTRDGRLFVIGARGEDSGAAGIDGNRSDNSTDEAGAVYMFRY